jgi:hypothetical protein
MIKKRKTIKKKINNLIFFLCICLSPRPARPVQFDQFWGQKLDQCSLPKNYLEIPVSPRLMNKIHNSFKHDLNFRTLRDLRDTGKMLTYCDKRVFNICVAQVKIISKFERSRKLLKLAKFTAGTYAAHECLEILNQFLFDMQSILIKRDIAYYDNPYNSNYLR